MKKRQKAAFGLGVILALCLLTVVIVYAAAGTLTYVSPTKADQAVQNELNITANLTVTSFGTNMSFINATLMYKTEGQTIYPTANRALCSNSSANDTQCTIDNMPEGTYDYKVEVQFFNRTPSPVHESINSTPRRINIDTGGDGGVPLEMLEPTDGKKQRNTIGIIVAVVLLIYLAKRK